ncbi:DUF2254 domain-containing protein [Vreelandella rituensis]|uniref:DUF2254 domain-containing protein n=1 Tax=Vreelandella rituensis TaxID=2282306 RepID=A0A368TWJ2_9GAMM|nr:DUF2254 family protein [Halomonas rituensis]RCV89070.1 DUF2254 domain-containing protein [Halomonas rituensis]
MKKRHFGKTPPRLTSLHLGKITLAMGVALAIGLGLGLAVMAVDTIWLSSPPVELGNVAGARVLMGSVLSGLITVAVFGLWMRTVVVGLMASHFSPRTLLIFLDDNFQRNLLAFMSAGVMTVLVILLRLPTEDQASAPFVSTVLVALIALAAMAGVLLAIQHATRSLSLPELISRLAENVLKALDRLPEERLKLKEVPPPLSEPQAVQAQGAGWVTNIDIDQMRKALPAGGVIHLRHRVGEFVTPRSTIALVSSTENKDEVNFDAVAGAFKLARTRSPDMDIAFTIIQLVDVGTFALQSADTSTSYEVMVHLEGVLEEIIDRGLPQLHDKDEDDRYIYDDVGWNAADLVRLCAERLRGPASQDPEAARHLMKMLHRVRKLAEDCEAAPVVSEVEHQAEMLRALAKANGMLFQDRQRLEC